jgi:hypothetical protein
MTLVPYTQMREDEAPQLGCGPKPCWLDLCVRKCPQRDTRATMISKEHVSHDR